MNIMDYFGKMEIVSLILDDANMNILDYFDKMEIVSLII